MIRGRPPRCRAPSWRRSRGARAAATSFRITGGRGGRVGLRDWRSEFLGGVLVGSLSAPYRAAFSALTPSFSTRTSIRRFCWRPAAESLLTNGYLGP